MAVIFLVALVTTVAVLVVDKARVELKLASRNSQGFRAEMNARSGLAYAQGVLEKASYKVSALTTESGSIGNDGWILDLTQESDDAVKGIDGLAFDAVITDENGRVDINTASGEILKALPGMTDEIAAAIVDWRDTDDNVTTGGGEEEWYATLVPPLKPRNAPFATLEELLSVKGMTKQLFYTGAETNADSGATRTGTSATTVTGSEEARSWPLKDLLTVDSSDPNLAADGRARISLNTPGVQLAQQINTRVGLGGGDATSLTNALRTWQRGTLGQFARVLPGPLNAAVKGRILDSATPGQPGTAKGRVNVLTAPEPVITAVFGAQAARTLLERRSSGQLRTLWDVYTALGQSGDRLDSATMNTMTFRFDVTGSYGKAGVKRSIRAVAGVGTTGWKPLQWVR